MIKKLINDSGNIVVFDYAISLFDFTSLCCSKTLFETGLFRILDAPDILGAMTPISVCYKVVSAT